MTPRLLAISPACHEPVNRAVFRELAGRGITVHLVVPNRHFVGGAWRETEIRPGEGYELTLLDIHGRNLRLQRLSGLRAVAKRFAPSHVYVDADPASLLVIQASMTARRARISALTAENMPFDACASLVAAVRALDIMSAANVAVKALLRGLGRLRLDRVFTLSDDGTQVVESSGMRATKLPLGYDPALFYVQTPEKRAKTRARLGLTEPTVAYFGRVVPQKGIHLMIEALAQLKDHRWQILLDQFSGTDGYVAEIANQVERLGISDRLVFFEARHEDMPDFMNAADIVVLPSISTPKWKEQYGRVIQEAQACGCRVIASDSGAIPETMDGQGALFPEGDVTALADLLRAQIYHPKGRDRAAAASARAHRSIQRQADILEAYLREPGTTCGPRCDSGG